MTELRINIASDINRAHELASSKAEQAVAHAIEAGKLLLEAKAALPHGEWLPWLEENIWLSSRQARRYMQVAQGRPLPVRALATGDRSADSVSPAKSDTVSVLVEDWMPRPAFIPLADHWCWCSVDGVMAYVVEPSSAHPGFFHISHLHAGSDEYDCTRRPIRADFVETWLQGEGLGEPAKAFWHVRPSEGVAAALDTLNAAEVA